MVLAFFSLSVSSNLSSTSMFYHGGRVASEKGVNYAKNSDSRYQRIVTEIHSQTGQSYSNFQSLLLWARKCRGFWSGFVFYMKDSALISRKRGEMNILL